jgi:hypothetical protein
MSPCMDSGLSGEGQNEFVELRYHRVITHDGETDTSVSGYRHWVNEPALLWWLNVSHFTAEGSLNAQEWHLGVNSDSDPIWQYDEEEFDAEFQNAIKEALTNDLLPLELHIV